MGELGREGWWAAWSDLVHGSRCVACGAAGLPLCRTCDALLPVAGHEVRPTPCPPGLVRCFAAGEYADPLRALVLAHKESQAFGLARPLGRVLAGVIAGLLDRAEPDLGEPGSLVLVPVPSRRATARARGHDPMLRITRAAAVVLRVHRRQTTVLRLLRPRLRVADQAGLDAIGRAANLRDSMSVEPRARAVLARTGRPVQVVVCDDVLTTGATAREAQRALADGGVPVSAVACVAATRRLHVPAGHRSDGSLPISPTAH